MEPTIFGMPQSAVVNQLQNIAMFVLTAFAARAHLSSDFVGQWAGVVGFVVTAVANHFSVRSANGDGVSSSGLPNGPTLNPRA